MRKLIPLPLWDRVGVILLNLLALGVVVVYLFPMLFMFVTAFKTDAQMGDLDAPVYPARRVTVEIEETPEPEKEPEDAQQQEAEAQPTRESSCGLVPCLSGFGSTNSDADSDSEKADEAPDTPQIKTYDVYTAPDPFTGEQWALIKKGRKASTVANIETLDAPFEWEGQWRSLEPVYEFELTTSNFTADTRFDFWKLVGNTMQIAIFSSIGMVIASVLVAYGFARYPLPGGRFLFFVLIATIILPEKITLVPTYFTFVRVLDWNETFLPLIVPHLFGSAILIFLLRQNFMALPSEIEQAAMIDGAGPLRILWSVIIPQSIPVIMTVLLLHFFYAWNETRMAVLYLTSAQELHPISMGSASGYDDAGVRQAQALMTMIIPALLLFIAQPVFMRGVKVTGNQ